MFWSQMSLLPRLRHLELYAFSPFLGSPRVDSSRTWAKIGSNRPQLFLDISYFLHGFLYIKALCLLKSDKCV